MSKTKRQRGIRKSGERKQNKSNVLGFWLFHDRSEERKDEKGESKAKEGRRERSSEQDRESLTGFLRNVQ